MKIIPENTAISNGTSNSCKLLAQEFFHKKNDVHILDYGCGRLRNTKYLLENGFKTSILDSEFQLDKQASKIKSLNIHNSFNTTNINFNFQYDAILLSFVLNVIPDIEERELVLSNIYKLIKDDGIVYIEVRDNKFIKDLKSKDLYKDGVLTGKGNSKTFQKPYSNSELKDFLDKNNFKVISIHKKSNSIIAKVKKMEVS